MSVEKNWSMLPFHGPLWHCHVTIQTKGVHTAAAEPCASEWSAWVLLCPPERHLKSTYADIVGNTSCSDSTVKSHKKMFRLDDVQLQTKVAILSSPNSFFIRQTLPQLLPNRFTGNAFIWWNTKMCQWITVQSLSFNMGSITTPFPKRLGCCVKFT